MYSVVIPVLNEVENLRVLLPQVLNPHCEVIICDNGSTDGTVELVRANLKSPDLHLKLSEGRGTVTDAILRGVQASNYDSIVVMDGDLSHPPEAIQKIVNALDIHDLVIGSRYCKGGKSLDTFLNRFISKLGNYLTLGLAFGIRDRMSGFFGIRKTLAATDIRQGCKPMLEYLVRGNPTSYTEIPYTFTPRVYGETKIGRSGILYKTLTEVFNLYAVKYKQFIKFVTVGGIGALFYMGFTYLFASVLGMWILYGALVGAMIATLWNFTFNKFWTFGSEGGLNGVWNLGHRNEDGNFEWWEWYGIHFVKRYWKRKMGNYVKELGGEPVTVLSLGCGSSPLINLFHCTRVGVDISKDKVEFLRRHSSARVIEGDITKFRYGNKFECVLCNEVLEHLENPRDAVKTIAEHTADRAVISIPDYGVWYGRLFENLFHRGFHKTLTVKELDEMCKEVDLMRVASRRFLWDTVILYRKGHPGRENLYSSQQ